MAQKIVKTRLVHRKDLSTKWSSVNPILLDGEMGIERDTRKFKIGDGVTSWNDLPYANVTYDVFNSKFSIGNDENTPGTAPVRDDSNQIHVNTTSRSDSTVAVNKGYMEQHVEAEINKISQGGKVATLGEDGKIPASQLPSYVDDVVEGRFLYPDHVSNYPIFIIPLSTHKPITTGPLEKLYFNFEKYKDKGTAAMERIFPEIEVSRYNLLKFESEHILSLIIENNKYYGWKYTLAIIEESSTSYTTTLIIYTTSVRQDNPVPTEPIEIPGEYGQVVEIYSENESILHSVNFMDFISTEPFPENDGTKDAGKIYVEIDKNKTYRWSGTTYTEISSSLALGETSSTAYAGNKGKQNATNIAALQTQVEGLQPKEDSTLKTTSKTVPGAINELKQKQDTNSTNIQTNNTNITKLQQDLTAANTSIASNFNRITDLEGVADEVLIEIEEINEKIAQGGGGGGTVTVEDSFVTVNKLPEIIVPLPGTPTPTGESVYIENLYFNTNLSVEEVTNIILNYCEENNLYNEHGTASINYVWGSDNKKQINITVSSGSGMYIKDNAYPSFTYYWCNEQCANANMGNYNITKVGWQDFENPLVIDENVNAPYKPMELFSITPLGEGLNPNIKEEKIYRLFEKEEPKWVGTPIPNTGQIDGFYFNISLSIEEVEKIINTLDFSNGTEYQVMWFNTGMTSDDIKIEKYEDGAMRITSASGSNTYWCNQKYKDNYDNSGSIQNIGWGASASSWNDEGYVRLSYEFYSTMYGNPVGDQNDKLSELLSLTPFEYVEGKEELDGYYRFKNNKWIKVLEEPDIMDVDKLPEGGWQGTVVPNTGTVEKIYFNTELSDEEVEAIFDKVCPEPEPVPGNPSPWNQEYHIVCKDDDITYMEIAYYAYHVYDEDDNYVSTIKSIYYNLQQFDTESEQWGDPDYADIWCNKAAAEDFGLQKGWQEFTNPIEIGLEVQDRWDGDEEPTLGIYNDQLTALFSTTPFTKSSGGDPNKIYRVQTEGGWQGTVVPNSGTVEKVYFNTELSDAEVEEIINTLTPDETGNGITGSYKYFNLLFADYNEDKESFNYYIYIDLFYNNDTNQTSLVIWDAGEAQKIIWANQYGASDNFVFSGWHINSDDAIEINSAVSDIAGNQNDKLTSLFSTTPFTKQKGGTTYYRKKDDKWIKVLEDTLIVDVEELPSNPEVELDKLYRVPDKSGAASPTPVPNTGYVEKVYVNTSLSDEEVEALIDKICPVDEENTYMEYRVIYDGSDNSYKSLSISNGYYRDNNNIIGKMKAITYFSERYEEDWITEAEENIWFNELGAKDWGVEKSGWQNFNNPITINFEVVSIKDEESGRYAGYLNDQLTSLVSTTPYGSSEPTGYDYYQFKNGAPKKILNEDDAVLVKQVEELPAVTIDTSTAVPSSGQVGKVYFNTKLSVEEVNAILSELDYVEGVLDAPAYAVATTADMSQGLVIMSGILGDGSTMYVIVTGNGKYIYQYLPGDPFTPLGFQYSEIDLNIDNMLSALAPQVGMTIQNDKLKNLISSTPFEAPNTDIELDKLYRTPIKGVGEWVGTVVPNSGVIEKVYFNTQLQQNEVKQILNSSVTWIDAANLGLSGFEFYPILAYMNGSYPFVFAMKKYTVDTDIHLTGDINIAVINFANMETILDIWVDTVGGWLVEEPYPVGLEVLPELSGIPIGTQNELISSIFSTSPFTKINEEVVGYKYHQFVNGEWKELGSGGEAPIIITISGLSLNNDNPDYTQIKPFITDKLWETITTNNNVVLKLIHNWASIATLTTYLQKYGMLNNLITGEVAYVIFSTPSSNQSLVIYKSSGDGYTVEVQGSNPLTNFEIAEDETKIEFNVWRGTGNPPEVVQEISKTNSGDIIIPNNTNLVTAKAVYEFVTNYMSANYDNGDEEEF